MGMPEAELTLSVDVSAHLDAKRDAMRCHRSQIEDTSFFLQMPDEVFARRSASNGSSNTTTQPPVRSGWIFPTE